MSRLGPLRHKPFRFQFIAVSISAFGTTLTPVALAFSVLDAAYSASDLGLVLGANALATTCAVLFGGTFADLRKRTTVMAGADTLRGTVQLATGIFLAMEGQSVVVLVILQLAFGIGTGFFEPADDALTPATVRADEIQDANALIFFVRNTFGISGPLVAGVATVSGMGPYVIMIDGLTFLISAFLVTRIALPPPTIAPIEVRNIWKATAEGLRTALARPWLRRTLIFFLVYGIVYSSVFVLGPAALNALSHGAILWSLVTVGLAIGNVVGSLAALRYRPAKPIQRLYLTSGLAIPLLVVLGVPGGPVLCLAAGIAGGMAFSLTNILWLTTLQTRVPLDRLARINALDTFVSIALRPAGYALAPVIAALTSTRAVLWSGAVTVAACIALCSIADLRHFDDIAPVEARVDPESR